MLCLQKELGLSWRPERELSPVTVVVWTLRYVLGWEGPHPFPFSSCKVVALSPFVLVVCYFLGSSYILCPLPPLSPYGSQSSGRLLRLWKHYLGAGSSSFSPYLVLPVRSPTACMLVVGCSMPRGAYFHPASELGSPKTSTQVQSVISHVVPGSSGILLPQLCAPLVCWLLLNPVLPQEVRMVLMETVV